MVEKVISILYSLKYVILIAFRLCSLQKSIRRRRTSLRLQEVLSPWVHRTEGPAHIFREVFTKLLLPRFIKRRLS